MEYQSQLAKKVELASGLKVFLTLENVQLCNLQELEAAFGDISYLNNELKSILQAHDRLFEESDEKGVYFDRIVGIIVDLFIDSFKVNGQSVGSRANDLLQILHEDYSLQNVLKFFQESKTQTQ
jgi:hypothetical protein